MMSSDGECFFSKGARVEFVDLNLICIYRNTVQMNDKDHNSLSIISAVPEEYQKNLFDKIDLIFPGAL